MNQQEVLNRIRTLLSRFEEEVRIDNANSEFSINIHAENVLINILNVAYDIKLTNINYVEGKTYPAIDLIDRSNRIAFQISSTGTVEKVIDTLIKYANYNLHEQCDHLYFYFLKGMEKGVVISNARIISARGKLRIENIHFLDHGEFYKYLNQINDIGKYRIIRQLLEEQFADPFPPSGYLKDNLFFLPDNRRITESIDISETNKPTVTFLIGNGFDLSMKMKTEYKDFFKWYCLHDMHGIKEQYKSFVENRMNEKRWNTWSDFEKDLVEFANGTSTDSERQDFRNLYIDLLYKIAEYIRSEQAAVLEQLHLEDREINYRFKESILNWKNELTEEQKSVINWQTKLFGNCSDYNYKFINFNYSRVFDELLSSKRDIIHIHGSIDDPKNQVMGVDDALLISTSFKAEELKYLLKNNYIDELQEEWTKIADKYLRNSNIICIYGMSIGRTDSTWWKKTIKWLLLEGHVLVIYWHRSKGDEMIPLKKLRKNVINRLLSFGELRDNEESILMTKIHVVIDPKELLKVTLNKKP